MTFHAPNAATVAPIARMWTKPTDAPDIMPDAGMDALMQMRRVAILNDVIEAAKYIWSWGTPEYAPTLSEAVCVACDGFRCRQHIREYVEAFIAEYVPGGLDANLRDFDRDVLRDLMRECRVQAQAKLDAIRLGMAEIRGLK